MGGVVLKGRDQIQNKDMAIAWGLSGTKNVKCGMEQMITILNILYEI
jgi:hypothetical protein